MSLLFKQYLNTFYHLNSNNTKRYEVKIYRSWWERV